ncbi:alpha-L-arabinofuranosidase [Victivallis vadensis]|uniref:alpha-L-arabinofuranosidase n=1 Tax=Victivallis vadensis TaxID=172901 RepID=UPI003D01E8C6
MLWKSLFAALGCAAALTVSAEAVRITPGGVDRPLISARSGEKTIRVKVEAANPDGLTLDLLACVYGERNPVAKVLKVPAKAETELRFRLPSVGIYDLCLIARRDGREVARTYTNYAVTPAPDYPRPDDFGACTHFAQGKGDYRRTFEYMKLAGFTRLRDDLPWSGLERKPKVYTISERIEKMVDIAPNYGIRPLLVTGYNTPAYKFARSFPTTGEQRAAFADAVAFAVKHFGNRVTEWEIWNEPNAMHPVNDYLPLLKEVYPKARAANPGITVISCGGGGAGGGPGGGMIVPILKAGGREFMDGFSIHPYMSPSDPDFGYAGYKSPIPRVEVRGVTRYLTGVTANNRKADGSQISCWVTEIGWPLEHPAARPDPVTEMKQAVYFARTMLLFRSTGSGTKVFWYDFQDDGVDPKNKEHNFGLIRTDYSPKPSYQAAAFCAWALRNRAFAGDLHKGAVITGPWNADRKALADGKLKIYQYGHGGDAVVALWAGDNRRYEVEFQLPFPYEQAIAFDWQGRRGVLPGKLDGNRIKLPVDFKVQYIVNKGK